MFQILGSERLRGLLSLNIKCHFTKICGLIHEIAQKVNFCNVYLSFYEVVFQYLRICYYLILNIHSKVVGGAPT